MDDDTVVLEMTKRLASRDVMTCMNLVMVQIKDIQALVLRNHDLQTHNQPLIAAEFARVAKRSAMTGKQIEKGKAETDKKFSSWQMA